MARLRILLTRRGDGAIVLKCVRADGTETWQKATAQHAAHFPLHDLTHFAVEHELGIRDAFFGLIAGGWSLEDTEGKGPRGPLPMNAILVENLVGLLDMERASGSRWTAAEFNEALAAKARQDGRPAGRPLSDDEIDRIRATRARLFRQWDRLPPDETLELALD